RPRDVHAWPIPRRPRSPRRGVHEGSPTVRGLDREQPRRRRRDRVTAPARAEARRAPARLERRPAHARARKGDAHARFGTHDALDEARQDAVAFVAFAAAFRSFARVVFGSSEAFGFRALSGLSELGVALAIPGMLMLRDEFPQSMDQLRTDLREVLPRLLAF